MKKRIAWSLVVGLLASVLILGVSTLCPPFYWGQSLILACCGWFVISVVLFMMNPSVGKE